MAPVKNILMTGESPLVEEYSAACAEHGLSVADQPGSAPDLALELTNTSVEEKKKNLVMLESRLPSGTPILSSAVTVTVAEQATWLRHPARLAGIGAFPTLLQGSIIELVAGNATSDEARNAASAFTESLGKSPAWVADSVGLVMPRILCMLANEAYFAMGEGTAGAQDIDTAMRLGTNYPAGPVEWAGRIGIRHIHAVIAALHRHFGEDRYRAAPLLFKESLTVTAGS